MGAPQTIAQKILTAHGVADPTPGAFGLARVDLVMANDVSGSVAISEFERIGTERVFDPARVALFADHFAPAKDTRSAALLGRLRRFANQQGIDQYWETGATPNGGIEHTVLAEEGLVAPGDLIAGGDSHSCTYGAFGAFGTGVGSTDIASVLALGELWVRVPASISTKYHGLRDAHVTGKDLILAFLARRGVAGARNAAVEFTGSVIDETSIDERMALCNMAVEAGAKTGIVPADQTTIDWLAGRIQGREPAPVTADPDADYADEVIVDVTGMRPLVACPHSPANVRGVDELDAIHVDQVYVGNCSNGTLTDLRQLCRALGTSRVARGTRLIVVPASQRVYLQALTEGLIAQIVEAGGAVSMPTCGACFGGHTGILDAGEVAVTTTNRNFRGRMGHAESAVYLANAYVAGASAVAGEIVDPRAVMTE
jgi:3-isopropylmalate/(R)-2-methylmalate dehydratase large subunit